MKKLVLGLLMAAVIVFGHAFSAVADEETESAMAETVAETEAETEATEELAETEAEAAEDDVTVADVIAIIESLTPEQIQEIGDKIAAAAEQTGWDGFASFVKSNITAISWIVFIIGLGIYAATENKNSNKLINASDVLNASSLSVTKEANEKTAEASEKVAEASKTISEYTDKITTAIDAVHAQAEEVNERNEQMKEMLSNYVAQLKASKDANCLFASVLEQLIQLSNISDTKKDLLQSKYEEALKNINEEGASND